MLHAAPRQQGCSTVLHPNCPQATDPGQHGFTVARKLTLACRFRPQVSHPATSTIIGVNRPPAPTRPNDDTTTYTSDTYTTRFPRATDTSLPSTRTLQRTTRNMNTTCPGTYHETFATFWPKIHDRPRCSPARPSGPLPHPTTRPRHAVSRAAGRQTVYHILLSIRYVSLHRIPTFYPGAVIGIQSAGRSYGPHDPPVQLIRSPTHTIIDFRAPRHGCTFKVVEGCALCIPKHGESAVLTVAQPKDTALHGRVGLIRCKCPSGPDYMSIPCSIVA